MQNQPQSSFARLLGLFAAFYFMQGIGEPTEGLIAQPVRSLLMRWGQTTGQISTFTFIIGMPWSLKPIYGLLSDFVPLWGYRRKSYLIITSAAAAVALFALAALPLGSGDGLLLLALLLVPAIGLAFSDVVIDALMIERGQPHGWTGQLQSVQWTSLFAATALCGIVGGQLSEDAAEWRGFLLCGIACLCGLILSCAIKEQAVARTEDGWRSLRAELVAAFRIPALRGTALFLVLWNFNPFSTAVLHVYVVRELELSQQFFGQTVTLTALASMAGTALYGLVRKRIPFRWLLHASIVLGIVSTAGYLWMVDETSARWVSAAVGFASAVAVLIQLDLAAQVCPVQVAGTVFAVLMSLANLSMFVSGWVGGYAYDYWAESGTAHGAFDRLVIVGGLLTAGCWFVLPWLTRSLKSAAPASSTSA